MRNIIKGVLDFRNRQFANYKDLFGELADGQNPHALFITCSDSRIDPNLMTNCKPGELFICRNAGNIIPPHSKETGGMTASIEYAVAVLGIKDIIICGHTDCGAIRGALHVDGLKGLPHVKEWLGHCRSAIEIVRERNNLPADNELDDHYLNEAIEENVRQQVQHIRTHPIVAAKLATKKLNIHGWVYDIKHGNVRCCSHNNDEFNDFDTHYADHIASIKAQC